MKQKKNSTQKKIDKKKTFFFNSYSKKKVFFFAFVVLFLMEEEFVLSFRNQQTDIQRKQPFNPNKTTLFSILSSITENSIFNSNWPEAPKERMNNYSSDNDSSHEGEY